MVEQAFAATGGAVSDESVTALTAHYLAIYRRFPVVETTPYPGVREVLEEFRAAGVVMGVCTNKPHEMSILVLDRLELSRFFASVIGGDVLAVFVGSEAFGLPPRLLEALDERVTIPMAEDVDSYSVNAAAAILLHEVGRRSRPGRRTVSET